MGHRVDPLPQTIDSYLRELNASLRGPAKWRQRVIIEIEDGLREDLAAAVSNDGDVPNESDVVHGWGPVRLIAEEFNESVWQLRARHMALRIIQLILPAILGWALVVALSPDPWPSEPVLVKWVAPMLYASVVAAVAGAAQLTHSGVARRAVDAAAVVCACAGIGVGTVSIAVLLTYRLIAADGRIFWPATVVSGMLTLTLVALVISNARHLRRHPLTVTEQSRRPA